MTLSIERLKNVINLNSPIGLRKLLSEYIRICGQIETQRSCLLDLKLAINRIVGNDTASLLTNLELPIIKSVTSKTRCRSFTTVKIRIQESFSPLMPQELKQSSMRRARSHSAKAANF